MRANPVLQQILLAFSETILKRLSGIIIKSLLTNVI